MSGISEAIPVGVVIRRQPGVTRWARWIWRPVAVIPHAGSAGWRELGREGEAVDYLAAICPLTLHRGETEAYRIALSMKPPCLWVVLQPDPDGPQPVSVHCVTASAHEAQHLSDSGEDSVEPVPMPPVIAAWVGGFVAAHHAEETFVKRRRDRIEVDLHEDGRGDARIRQPGDVYRSPAGLKRGRGEEGGGA